MKVGDLVNIRHCGWIYRIERINRKTADLRLVSGGADGSSINPTENLSDLKPSATDFYVPTREPEDFSDYR